MILTEEQTKTKWCPFARGSKGANRADAGDTTLLYGNCIASVCMAWRWHLKPDTTLDIKSGREIPIAGQGSCGMAGTP